MRLISCLIFFLEIVTCVFCYFSDEQVIDICSNTEMSVQGYGHIVYWPKVKTYSSCSCLLHGASSMDVLTFFPLFNSDAHLCASRGYSNGQEISCATNIQGLPIQPTNNLTLVTPGNDRLSATFWGLFFTS